MRSTEHRNRPKGRVSGLSLFSDPSPRTHGTTCFPRTSPRPGHAFPEALAACADLDALVRLKGAYVGREGSHAARLMELLKLAPKEQKRDLGAAVNALKQQWEEGLKSRQAEIEAKKKNRRALATSWDPSLPPPLPAHGALHPLNRLMDRLVEVFRPLGFHVEEGPEIETEAHNFDGLNIPEDHPAKASSDTFYLAAHPDRLLRTHTSPVQVRVLHCSAGVAKRSRRWRAGGIRFLAPGRVYRKDEIDPTHSPMFHQVEGMLVGHGIGMHHLKGTLEYAPAGAVRPPHGDPPEALLLSIRGARL